MVLFTLRAEAQVPRPEVHHVRWPLLDIIMLPDSASLWILAGPNPGTRQWESKSHLVDFSVDPVLAFQWVTVARRLVPPPPGRSLPDTAARVTPPLRARKGPGFLLLGTNTKPSADRSFILLVSDSTSRIHWKSFASAVQVDSLLTALELSAVSSQAGGKGWDIWDCEDPDTPVGIVSQPRPAYPSALGDMGRIGALGRPELLIPSEEGPTPKHEAGGVWCLVRCARSG